MTQVQSNYDVRNDSEITSTRKANYGRTIGEPELSDEAREYYNQLKKKFNNYDFILVSRDEKENAKRNAGSYAGGLKTVVLIDEDKIERMATDPEYRKQYEDILSGAMDSLNELKSGLNQGNSFAKSFGLQVNDDGTVSYFAVLKDMSAAQKERIEKKAEEKKAEEKKAEERLKGTTVISADSAYELLRKIEDYEMNERSNLVMTDSEKMLGQNIDFRG